MRRSAAMGAAALLVLLATASCLSRYTNLGVSDPSARDRLRGSRIAYATKEGVFVARGDGSDRSLVLPAAAMGDGGAVFLPSLTGDGRSLAFLGLDHLDVIDSTGRELSLNIVTLADRAVVSWRKVVLSKIVPPRDDGRFEVFTAAAASWSPDGDRIALGLDRPADRGGDLVMIVDRQGVPVRSFSLGGRDLTRVSGIAWLRDASAILIGLHAADGVGAVVARLTLQDGDHPAGAIRTIGAGAFPAIDPGGRRIAVIDAHDGFQDIVVMTLGGDAVRRFARPPGRALTRPFWSADGRYLYYYSLASTGPLGLIEITMLRCLDTGDSRVYDLVRLG